ALKLLTQGGRKFKRAAICRRAEAQGAQDVPVLICDTESNQQIRARLIVLPLPPEQAEAARRGMRKNACKWGYTPSDDALAPAGHQFSPASFALALYRPCCLLPDPRGPCRPQIRSNSRLQNPRTARRAPTPTMYAGKPRLARMGSSPAMTTDRLLLSRYPFNP